jgi:hypothetical protein
LTSDSGAVFLVYQPLTNNFKFRVHRGSSADEDIYAVTAPTPDTASHGFYLEIEMNPYTDTLKGYVDGVLGVTVEGYDTYPKWQFETGDQGMWACLMVMGGNHASGRCSGAFSHIYHEILDPFSTMSHVHV